MPRNAKGIIASSLASDPPNNITRLKKPLKSEGAAPKGTSSADIIANWRLPSAVAVSVAGGASLPHPYLPDPILRTALRRANIPAVVAGNHDSVVFHPQPFEGYVVSAVVGAGPGSVSAREAFNLAAAVTFYGGSYLAEMDAVSHLSTQSDISPTAAPLGPQWVIVVDEATGAQLELAMIRWAISATHVWSDVACLLGGSQQLFEEALLSATESVEMATNSCHRHYQLQKSLLLLLTVQRWKKEVLRVAASQSIGMADATRPPILLTLPAVQQCIEYGLPPALLAKISESSTANDQVLSDTLPVQMNVASIIRDLLPSIIQDSQLARIEVTPKDTLIFSPMGSSRIGGSGPPRGFLGQTPDARTPAAAYAYNLFIDKDSEDDNADILGQPAARELFASSDMLSEETKVQVKGRRKPKNRARKARNSSDQRSEAALPMYHRRVTFSQSIECETSVEGQTPR